MHYGIISSKNYFGGEKMYAKVIVDVQSFKLNRPFIIENLQEESRGCVLQFRLADEVFLDSY